MRHEPDIYDHLSEPLIYRLDQLLESVSPTELRKSLHELLFHYLTQSYDIQRNDFRELMQHMHLLTEFLQDAEEMVSTREI